MALMSNMQTNYIGLGYLARRHISCYWKQILLLVFLSLIAATLTSLQPILLAPALDISMSSGTVAASHFSELTLNNIGATIIVWLAIPSDPLSLVLSVVAIFFLVGALGAVTDFSAHMLSSWIGINAYADLKIQLYKHLLSLDLKFFLNNRANELTSRFINDAGEVATSIDISMRQGLEAMLQILIYGFLLFQTSISLALAVATVSASHFLINRFLKNRVQNSTADRFDKLADTGNMLSECFSNIRIVKCFTAEEQENQRFQRALVFFRQVSMRFSLFKHSETPLRKITDSFALGFILILAFREMQSHELTPSGFLLFMIVVRQTIAPISVFAQSLIRLHGGLGSARRVLEILKTQPEQKQGQHNLHDFKNKIDFNNVTFGYDPHRPVLRNINFSFMRGEVLAVVGSSGAGKSTLADLLVRLFDPLEGEILIDGVPITKYSLKSYRQLFGVVPQESLLNHLTVAENISFGDEEGAPERLEHAIQIANAKEFIDNLPAKLDTPIGDRGVRISGGQRQRLAIARAVYINPKVLVLDEATSALDSESERAVQIAINKILENSTAFIIAHRLSTIRHADRILVMNNGEIEAIGSAEDLMRTSPTYRKLYNLHFDMEKNA
jgi:ABC-type multidrug transport system fused ATPase/permease subunit